jgi:anti-sigma28 factor (negative regulator of flagellin synthesis)
LEGDHAWQLKQAHAAAKAGKPLTPAQQQLLEGDHAWQLKLAHAAANAGQPLTPEQHQLLEGNHAWQTQQAHAAAKAGQPLTPEQLQLLESDLAWQFKQAKATPPALRTAKQLQAVAVQEQRLERQKQKAAEAWAPHVEQIKLAVREGRLQRVAPNRYKGMSDVAPELGVPPQSLRSYLAANSTEYFG